jgi:SAM-dependent methyltransferase
LETGQANLTADAFVGTAEAYLRYRPPYPKALLDDLLRRGAPPAVGVLLDLACGPGRVALDLAGSFATVLANDLEPEMIEVGRKEAARRGIGGVTWLAGRAEDLDLAPSSVDLITIGEAFHRLDQGLIAQKALGWLRPGGSLASLGTDGLLDGREPWQKTVSDVARRWMSRAFPAGWAQGLAGTELGPGAPERVLRAAGFAEVASHSFREPRDWSIEEIIGYLQSTSVCSKKALGEDFPQFEADLKTALLHEPGASFHEELGCGYTLGRKPIP